MALTNAEKQAAYRKRRTQLTDLVKDLHETVHFRPMGRPDYLADELKGDTPEETISNLIQWFSLPPEERFEHL